jgi:hypothetical protein
LLEAKNGVVQNKKPGEKGEIEGLIYTVIIICGPFLVRKGPQRCAPEAGPIKKP